MKNALLLTFAAIVAATRDNNCMLLVDTFVYKLQDANGLSYEVELHTDDKVQFKLCEPFPITYAYA